MWQKLLNRIGIILDLVNASPALFGAWNNKRSLEINRPSIMQTTKASKISGKMKRMENKKTLQPYEGCRKAGWSPSNVERLGEMISFFGSAPYKRRI